MNDAELLAEVGLDVWPDVAALRENGCYQWLLANTELEETNDLGPG